MATAKEKKHGFDVVVKRTGVTNRGMVIPDPSVSEDVKFKLSSEKRENVKCRAQTPLDAKAVLRLEEIDPRTTPKNSLTKAAHSKGGPKKHKTSVHPAGGLTAALRATEKGRTELLAKARGDRHLVWSDISDLRCGCRMGDDHCPDNLHVCRSFGCMAVHSHKTREGKKKSDLKPANQSQQPVPPLSGAERRIKQGADKAMRAAGTKPGGGFRLCTDRRIPVACSLCTNTTDRYHCKHPDAVNPEAQLADEYDTNYSSELEGLAEVLEDDPRDSRAAAKVVSYLNSSTDTDRDARTLAMFNRNCGAKPGARSAFSDIYFETQVDDHCILHAFNNAMQSPEITLEHFSAHCPPRQPGSGFSLVDLTNYCTRFVPHVRNQHAERHCTRENLEQAIAELALHNHAFLMLVGQLHARSLGHAVSVVRVDNHTILMDSTAAPRLCDEYGILEMINDFVGLAFCFYVVDTARHPSPIRHIRHTPEGTPLPLRRDARVQCPKCNKMFASNSAHRIHLAITADICDQWEDVDARSFISDASFDYAPSERSLVNPKNNAVKDCDTASGTGSGRDNFRVESHHHDSGAPLPSQTPSLFGRAARCLRRADSASTATTTNPAAASIGRGSQSTRDTGGSDPAVTPPSSHAPRPRSRHLPAHHDPHIQPYTLFFQGHGGKSTAFMNGLIHAFLGAVVPFTHEDTAYVSGITHNLLIHPLMTSFSAYERSLIFGSRNPNAIFHELLHITSTYREDYKYLADSLRFDRCIEEYVHMPTLKHIAAHNSLLSPVAYNVGSRTFAPAMMARLENAAITPSPAPGVSGGAPVEAPGYALKNCNLTVFNNTIYAAHNYFVFKNVLQAMYMPTRSGLGASSSVHETFRAGARPTRLEYQDRVDLKPISTVPHRILRGEEHTDPSTGLPVFHNTSFLNADHSYSTLFGWNFTHTGIVLRLSNANMRFALRRVLGLRENDAAYDAQMRAWQSNYAPLMAAHFVEVYSGASEFAFRNYSSRLELLADAVLEPHPKRKLRIQAYEELSRDGNLAAYNHGCYRLTAKLKRFEYAKKGKNGRVTADYGVSASLVSFMLFKIVKGLQADVPFVYRGGEARHILSATSTDLHKAFNFIYDYSTSTTRMVYFSDDSVLRARYADGRISYYNMDISSCDRSHTPEVIALLYTLVPARLHPELRETIKQLSFPFDVFNVNNKREKVRYRLNRPFMFSGWTGTTALNNIGSLLIFLAACDTLTFATTREQLVAGIRERSGYDVTLDEHRTYADYQFLKHSPELDSAGGHHQVLNYGTVLRASGVCRGDLPGSGDLEPRARSFQSALMAGLQSAYNNPIIDALRLSCAGGPKLDAKSLEQLKEQHTHWEQPARQRIALTTDAFSLRYDATTDEIAELVHSIRTNTFNCSYSSSLIDRIMQKDYEYDPPQPVDYAAGSMVSLDG